ncbi:LytR/AlgR family response regulator transcription factor [Thermotalea metallivorans]|uniref:Stage 0 sporulation protein A homolog n=1 Tax=Thermotalea metallivorans TaxID=520762 RepID=A0A140L0Z6_9FIRM|nr:LytTR family DNA-binding domain-containing protein [Thermotalea metallivorans]KXG74221.1 Transcriptional regulatory protein YpdB [Thermotalea metallivorans]
MIVRVLIADDQEEMRRMMKKILEGLSYVKIVGEAKNGIELLDYSLQLNPDVIFIDIDIPGINGIEAAREIRKSNPHVHLIFATGYKEYRREAFDVYAMDYIQKPYDKERMIRTMERIKGMLGKRKDDEDRLVSIISNRNKRYIKTSDILFIEARNRKIFIYTTHEEIDSNESLNEIGEQLDQRFMRTHKSFIVNLDRIRSVRPLTRTSYSIYFDSTDKTACVSKELLDEMIHRAENINAR